MQPVKRDQFKVIRFQKNAIVCALLDFATPRGLSLNELAVMPFTKADRQQFAQLLGYSVSGYGELPYVTNAAYTEAVRAERKLLKRKKASR
jgi:hypothetical protein